MRRSVILPLAAFAAIWFGCSSSSSSPGDTNVDPTTACNDALSALCAKLDACAAIEVDMGYGSLAACKQRVGYDCPGVFALNGTSTTPALYEGCSKVIPSLDCNAVLTDLDSALQAQSACATTPGKLQNGTACAEDAQCASTFCAIDETTGCGVCSAQPSAGDPCINGACGHATGLVCATSTSKCVKPAAAGQACDPQGSQPCAGILSCVGTGTNGICTQPVGEGAQCQLGTNDQFPSCDITQSLLCQLTGNPPTTNVGTCHKIVEAHPGDTCTVIDAVKFCVGGATCGKTNADYVKAGGGTCVAPAADGASCADGTPCLAPAKCLGGVCKLVDPASCK